MQAKQEIWRKRTAAARTRGPGGLPLFRVGLPPHQPGGMAAPGGEGVDLLHPPAEPGLNVLGQGVEVGVRLRVVAAQGVEIGVIPPHGASPRP